MTIIHTHARTRIHGGVLRAVHLTNNTLANYIHATSARKHIHTKHTHAHAHAMHTHMQHTAHTHTHMHTHIHTPAKHTRAHMHAHIHSRWHAASRAPRGRCAVSADLSRSHATLSNRYCTVYIEKKQNEKRRNFQEKNCFKTLGLVNRKYDCEILCAIPCISLCTFTRK